jgi:leucyl-tRNA synthetase
MPRYDPARIETRWQRYWEDNETFKAADHTSGDKMYVLDMFPYPSGNGLHVGHPEGYTATDIVCRYQRMRGKHVLHPMGWDSFGLPAEEHAVKTGTHPRETTENNINTFRRQLKMLGFSYDWSREIATTDPAYYRWTQWIFLQLFDTWYDADCEWTGPDKVKRTGRGRPISELPVPSAIQSKGEDAVRRFQDKNRLAYSSDAPVNWCPGLGTVLANEEIIDGKSERGGHPVERLQLRQWMLRITAYADRLGDELEELDWTESIKLLQRNWIGRSTGAEVDFFIGDDFAVWKSARTANGFPAEAGEDVIRVYTTRPDTLYGATYMVLAPEHPLVDCLTTVEQQVAVDEYRKMASLKSDLDRTDLAREKTGVFTGACAVNPANGEPVPVWIADYVLISYGTGAIMAVPAHDLRDFEFAVEFDIPIVQVVQPPDGYGYSKDEQAISTELNGETIHPFAGHGTAVNSDEYNGLSTAEFQQQITQFLLENGRGDAAVNYKLRDWLFSRQRYWGEPFPIWHELDVEGNETGLMRAESVDSLPVPHPHLDDFKPTGTPLPMLSKASDEWLYKTDTDGTRLKRETNSMPQWAGSCWYFLRFCDPENGDAFIDPAKEKYWLPVDLYVGGAEHAVLHLLYSRFWHKVLFDRGYLSTAEPFHKLVNQGMILGENGEKMSKSRGNVINPDDVVNNYGADALRLYEMFMGPLTQVKPWQMQGVEGVYRFLGRVWRMITDSREDDVVLNRAVTDDVPSDKQRRILHKTIQAVTDDIDKLSFNTAISRMMEFTNEVGQNENRPKSLMEPFVLLLSPFAPHLAEECWQVLGHDQTLAYEPWPDYDESLIVDSEIEIPVQVNGKLRSKIKVAADADKDTMQSAAEADVRKQLDGKTIVKVIVVPGRMVNFVVKG